MIYEAPIYGGPMDGTWYTQPHPWLNIPELIIPLAAVFRPELDPADQPTTIDYRVIRYRYGPNPVDGSPAWLAEPSPNV